MTDITKSISDIDTVEDGFCFYGRIEKLSYKYVSGWAFISDMPGYSCKLEVWLGQERISAIRADISRDDVGVHAPSHRTCGFLFEFDDAQLHKKYPSVEDLLDSIVVKFHNERVVVDKSYAEIEQINTNSINSKNSISVAHDGYFDGLVGYTVKGWCIDRKNQKHEQQVCIKIDEAIVGYSPCNIYRKDIVQQIPSGVGGFEFRIPMRFFDGNPHYIQILEAVSGFNLPSSQQVFVLKNDFLTERQAIPDISNILSRVEENLEVMKHFIAKRRIEIGARLENYSFFYPQLIQVNFLARKLILAERAKTYHPLVSVVMPAYEGNPIFIRAAIESVQNQIYDNWELVISDDCTKNVECLDILKNAALDDPRIIVLFNEERGGISRNTNRALKVAKGEIIAFMDYDDLIEPEALLLAVEAFEDSKYDLIYTDEDKINEKGEFVQPHYKSAFNYDLLLGVNYICHMVFVTKTKLTEVGGLRSEFDGAQDWDLLLRLSEKTPSHRIGHIPRVLYHWRISPTSTASATSAKSYVVNAGLSAVRSHLSRTSEQAEAYIADPAFPFPSVIWKPDVDDLISVIIPTRDRIDLVISCISSLRMTTKNMNLEIIIVDNNSDQTSRRGLELLKSTAGVKIISWDGDFNYSAINNYAVSQASGKYVLLLNNDVYFSNSDWLRAMLGAAQRSKVGAVGLKLLYPDGTVQHNGVIIGQGGIAGHAFTGLEHADGGYFCRSRLNQEISAVTAACLLVSKDNFESVGGFDEQDLTVAFNDVDLCLNLRRDGLKNILINTHFAYHAESKSRGYEDSPAKQARFLKEIAHMKKKWGRDLQDDVFYNPNFDIMKHSYSEIDLEYASQETCKFHGSKLARSSTIGD